jgi:hypothetical protein
VIKKKERRGSPSRLALRGGDNGCWYLVYVRPAPQWASSQNSTPLDLAPQHIFWCVYVPTSMCQTHVSKRAPSRQPKQIFYSRPAAASSTYE